MPQDNLPLNNEQRETLNKKRLNFELTPFEAVVVKKIRSVKYGQVRVHLFGGIPLRSTIERSETNDPTEDKEMMEQLFGNEIQNGK